MPNLMIWTKNLTTEEWASFFTLSSSSYENIIPITSNPLWPSFTRINIHIKLSHLIQSYYRHTYSYVFLEYLDMPTEARWNSNVTEPKSDKSGYDNRHCFFVVVKVLTKASNVSSIGGSDICECIPWHAADWVIRITRPTLLAKVHVLLYCRQQWFI